MVIEVKKTINGDYIEFFLNYKGYKYGKAFLKNDKKIMVFEDEVISKLEAMSKNIPEFPLSCVFPKNTKFKIV